MDADKESIRWHATWIIGALLAFIVAGLTAWSSFEMAPLLIITAIFGLLAVALLWVITKLSSHLIPKITVSVFVTIGAIVIGIWIFRHDRPILKPEIATIVQGHDEAPTMAIEVSLKNIGRQPGYADSWRFYLNIDGATTEGREIFSQAIPSPSSEPEMTTQEFPPYKPVRGWLFFTFPGMSKETIAKYFACNSELLNKVTLKLVVVDAKYKREWSDVKNAKDLGQLSCIESPSGPAPIAIVQKPNQTRHSPPPSSPIQAPVIVNAPNGIGISGGTVTNPTVNNYSPPPAVLRFNQEVVADPKLEDSLERLVVYIHTDQKLINYTIRLDFSGLCGAGNVIPINTQWHPSSFDYPGKDNGVVNGSSQVISTPNLLPSDLLTSTLACTAGTRVTAITQIR